MRYTPGMQQYMDIKNQHPDTLVLFRMGDFYETFYEDAKTAARELGIALTARGKDETRAPLAGIPYHSLEPYLAKLINKGYKVAIVEQLEDPKMAKGLVKRGVVRIVTPGTVMESNILNNSNNYIVAINKDQNNYGIAIADISTGEFLTTEVDSQDKLFTEISKYQPKECIIPLSLEEYFKDIQHTNPYDDRHFWSKKAQQTILEHLNTLTLPITGEASIATTGALLSYLQETQKTSLKHINKIKTYSTKDFMILDSSTQRNLELTRNILDNSSKATLIETLDDTSTPMGTRLLKKWILQPLINIEQIQERQQKVHELVSNIALREDLRRLLKEISDIERLISRINYGNANPRDLLNLKNSLKIIPNINRLVVTKIEEAPEVISIIESTIDEEPPITIREGRIIKKGYNEVLDKLRHIAYNSKNFIASLEQEQREETGIKSLKVKYNKVFGYFIEVTKANLHLVPNTYIRKQTQVNAERYITQELKEQESLILNAEEKSHALEYELFQEIIKSISAHTKAIQTLAKQIGKLDVLTSFANIAVNNNYTIPEITNEDEIYLKESRHPVIEKLVPNFVPNDIQLTKDNKLQIITGPNMAGKSTIMRQVALITLMAHIGSFTPTTEARICITDRIFTRVGAHDDLARGQSTFMVEMAETANILNNASEKSLIILDEIGRGTSTYDGLSIAWAVAEYISKIQAKTMFATHYHQLNNLSHTHKNVKNYNIAVKETDEIVFLYKLVPGGTDKSYGIQVAKLAGVPNEVIERSREIMNMLEIEDKVGERIQTKKSIKKETELRQFTLMDI